MAISTTKKNVVVLASCQALAMTGSTVLFTVAALIGLAMLGDQSLATLPLAIKQLATMLATIPAALLLKQLGRKFGFISGVSVGLLGAALGTYAVFSSNFLLFCGATLLFGIFNGFVGYYRFAAADIASEAFRSQAIAFVVAGGIIAALIGPNLATLTKDWFVPAFSGCLIVVVGLQFLSLLLLTFIDLPPLADEQQEEAGRSLRAIAQQPTFIVAAIGSMIGYGVMALLMTATPLAMTAVQHPFHTAASVIQWHVLGMFVPSLFTGFLIARFGVLTIILTGIGLNGACIAVNLLGTGVFHFSIALLLLGIGWNFMFIGSTTLLTETYMPLERAKTQAMHDFLMFSFVAIATFLSGKLLNDFGWLGVNLVGLVMILVALVGVLWLWQQRQLMKRKLNV